MQQYRYLLPSLLVKFWNAHPGVESFIETGSTYDLAEHLRRGLLDVAFMVSSELLDKPELTIEATWNFEIAVVANARHTPRRCRMTDLRDYPFILYKEGSFFNDIIESYFKEVDLIPRVVMRLDNAEAIKAMVQSNLGLAMLPTWSLRGELASRELAVVRQSEKPLYASIALMTRNISYQPYPVRAFIKIARRWSWKNTQLQT